MTNAELAILSLIVEQPRHGYEIEQVIEGRGMRNWTEIGFSSIYYLLKKLEEKGLIEASRQPAEGRGPARKVYQVTDDGRIEWYREALETLRSPQRPLVPFLLGLSVLPAFHPEEARAALERYQNDLRQQRDALIQKAEAQQPLPPHVTAMFDYSVTLVQAELAWIKGFILQLES